MEVGCMVRTPTCIANDLLVGQIAYRNSAIILC
jgi:hypothetical protein